MEAHMNFATEPTNHAVGIHEFGGPSVVGVIERAIPRPLSDEVLVRVHAATVNPTDTLFRTGAQTGRMAGLTPPFTPGMEFAGQVVALGNVQGDLPEFQVRDRVAGVIAPWQTRGGAQARFVAAPASGLAHIPASMDYDEAGTVPMNGLTALMAVELLGLELGSRVLVTGGVGARRGACWPWGATRSASVVVRRTGGAGVGPEFAPRRNSEWLGNRGRTADDIRAPRDCPGEGSHQPAASSFSRAESPLGVTTTGLMLSSSP
jgi:NADPH-dependent curcumin reductase CurA